MLNREKFFNLLNKEQREAVEYCEGPLLVYAGAGTGKTRVITYKIVYLIEFKKISPNKILAVTFTNKAANEMKQRIKNLAGEKAEHLWMSTFHSFGLRFLRMHYNEINYRNDFTIYDEEDQLNLIKACIFEITKKIDIKASIIKYHINMSKSKQMNFNDYLHKLQFENDEIKEILFEIAKLYEMKKRESNVMDFDDLLIYPVTILKNNYSLLEKYSSKFEYILVDEFQDTNVIQYDLIKLLSLKNKNICVVGDDDQSIYSWRGANVQNILNFEKDFKNVKVIKLIKNYRSQQLILNTANRLISNNKYHIEKNLYSEIKSNNPPELIEVENEFQEADIIVDKIKELKNEYDLSQIAVFYRTNYQSRIIEEKLVNANIPYIVVGNISFYQRKEIKDILAYLKFIVNPKDNVSLLRIINIPKRGIGNATIERLLEIAKMKKKSIYETLEIINEFDFSGVKKLEEFYNLMNELIELSKTTKLSRFIDIFLKKINYIKMLEESNDEKSEDRIMNVLELVNSIKLFDANKENQTLNDYIESIALISDIDEWDKKEGVVNLMTLHSAKGLEFDVVFIIGMSEKLFPHINSSNTEEEIEEERRLCYVGITRAKKLLYLIYARKRYKYRSFEFYLPSRFLYEIFPDHEFNSYEIQEFSDENNYITKTRQLPNKTNFLDYQININNKKPKKEEKESEYKAGDRVLHKTYGEGLVMYRYADRIMIRFKNVGNKEFDLSIAKLKKIS